MANTSKAAENKNTESIVVRCSPKFKANVDEMSKARFGANGTEEGSVSTLVRDFLDGEYKRWKAKQPKKEAE
jgi:hypothetical protein